MSAEPMPVSEWERANGRLRAPIELQAEPHWGVWRAVSSGNGAKPKKVPHPRKNEPWWPYEQAMIFAAEHDDVAGLGFNVLDAKRSAIDLDNCRDPTTGGVVSAAQKLIDECGGAYCEVSPSGTGFKVVGARNDEPRFLQVNFAATPAASLLNNFFAVTGEGRGDPNVDISGVIDCWLEQLGDKKKRKGERRPALYSEAGRLRALGMAPDDMRRVLLEWAARNCVPPLDNPDRDVDEAVEWVMGKEGLDFPATESGHAEFFAAMYGDRLRYDHAERRWRIYDGHHWRYDVDGEVDRLVLEAGRARQHSAVGDKDLMKKMLKTEEARLRGHVERLARSERLLATDGEHWNPDHWRLGVANGVVDLRTGERRDGRPEDMTTLWVPVAYDAEARCPEWEAFIVAIFRGRPAMVAYIQRVLGYAITAEVTEQCFWILFGEGGNGKTTLLEVLRKVLGPYGWPIPFPGAGWSNALSEYQKASLVGRRLVISSEGGRVVLNDTFVKDLSGGDTINGRHPCGRPFDFGPVCKLFLRVNKKPGIRDRTHGMWRKVKLVEFRETFPVDRHFAERFDSELPGILAWLVRGAMEWQREGLTHPAEVEEATKAYREESDELGDFLTECCVTEGRVRVRAGGLFAAYKNWCDKQRVPADERLNLRTFGEDMAKRFKKDEVKGGSNSRYRGVWYVGVALAAGVDGGEPCDM